VDAPQTKYITYASTQLPDRYEAAMWNVIGQIISVLGFFILGLGTLFGIVYISHLLSRGQ
jgi:hypothetical protein